MTINLRVPDLTELKPRITVFGVGGAGGNAVNNMIACGLKGVEFVVANTDAQALASSSAERRIQMGRQCHRRPRRGLQARDRRRRGRRGDGRHQGPSRRLPHGVHHRRHGRRHRHRRCARDRARLARGRHPHRRRRHQAVPVRRLAPLCARPKAASTSCRNTSTRCSSSRTRTCSASPTRRPPSPTPLPWPTMCCAPASPASPTSWSRKA